MLLCSTETMPSKPRGPPKKRAAIALADAELAEEVGMTDDDLKAMSAPPERPTGASDEEFLFPGAPGHHAYECWCDACVATFVKRWGEFPPDGAVLLSKTRPKKPAIPYTWARPHPCGR